MLLKISVDGQAALESSPIRWCGPGSWSRGARRPSLQHGSFCRDLELTHRLDGQAWPRSDCRTVGRHRLVQMDPSLHQYLAGRLFSFQGSAVLSFEALRGG